MSGCLSFIFCVGYFLPLFASRSLTVSLTVDLLHVSKCRSVWSNTPRYFTNTCFRRRCSKRAAFRPFRRPALGRETNRPRNETPVVDLIYTPASEPAFIIYASTDRELLNRSVKNIPDDLSERAATKAYWNSHRAIYFHRQNAMIAIRWIFFSHLVNVSLLYYAAITLPDDGDYTLQRFL